MATQREQRVALAKAFGRTIGGPEDPDDWNFRMGCYRRSILNRDSTQWQTEDPELARLVVAYEEELRSKGLIDFDDMPLLAVKALRENTWLQRAMLAKYPVLVVDEYQDLGRALHRMVRACASAPALGYSPSAMRTSQYMALRVRALSFSNR